MNLGPWIKDLSPQCIECSEPSLEALCSRCEEFLRWPRHWQVTIPHQQIDVGYIYSEGLRHWLFSVKERGRIERLSEIDWRNCVLKADQVDAVVGCPSDPVKTKSRGYDFSENFGKALARRLDLPWRGIPFERMPFLRSQKFLSRREREQWMGKLIRLRVRSDAPLPERLLIVDDVVTTGATLEVCIRLLRAQGHQVHGFAMLGQPPLTT